MLKNIENYIPGLLIVVDLSLRVVNAAAPVAGYLGKPLEMLRGSSLRPFIHPDDIDQVEAHLRESRPLRLRLLISAEGWRWHDLRSRRGEGESVVLLATDIQEQVLAEREMEAQRAESFRRLEQQSKLVERAERLKNQFLANMSHELRTPLTAILGISEALEMGLYGDCSEEQRIAFHTINDCGKSLLGLINDILDVTKLETDEIKLEYEVLNLRQLLESVVRLHRKAAVKKRVTVQTVVDDDSLTFEGDRRRLKQVLSNLLSNAVKFTEEGSVVELRAGYEQGVLHVDVLDAGEGVAEADLQRAFQPFQQLDEGLARSHGGAGLGLSLVKKILRLMDGDLSVARRESKGSVFRIRLPVRPMALPHEEGAEAVVGSGRVLVVEDHPATSGLLCNTLASWGFDPLPVSSLAELRGVRVERCRLVLMDAFLEDGDGLQGIEWLQREPSLRETPVILLTAAEGSDLRRAGLEAGAAAYLEKPVRLNQLSRCITQILDGGRCPE